MFYLYQISCITTLIVTAHIGDYLLEHVTNLIYKAFFDNITHAIISLLAWVIVSLNIKYTNSNVLLVDLLLCFLIGSLIDLDHFCAAKSIHLKDATSLNHRPFLHMTTIPLAVSIILIGFSNNPFFEKLGLIVFVAFGTHHTRDAYRRGFWFAPFGSTPPLSYYTYILITLLIPYWAVFCWKGLRNARKGMHLSNNEDYMHMLIDV